MADAESIQCPACDRQVSPAALACPGCGHPIAASLATPPATLRTTGPTDRISQRQFAWSIWPFEAAVSSILLALMDFGVPFVVQIVGILLLLWIGLAVMYTMTAGRLRDVGEPPGMAWISFLGPLGLAFVLLLQFWPGQRDANKYGPAPYAPGVERPKLPDTVGKVSGVVAVVVWWVLVLALAKVGPDLAFALTTGGGVLIVLAWMGVSMYRFRVGYLFKERQPVAKRERMDPPSVAGFRGIHSYADWLDLDIIQREQMEGDLTPEERDKLRQMKTIHFKLDI